MWTKSNLVRQATEAYKIENTIVTTLINRRGEWGNDLPPRLTLGTEEGRYVQKEQPRKRPRVEDVADQDDREVSESPEVLPENTDGTSQNEDLPDGPVGGTGGLQEDLPEGPVGFSHVTLADPRSLKVKHFNS